MMRIIIASMLFATALSLTGCASPPDRALHRARVALQAHHYHAALDNYAFAASYGIPEAEYATGYLYYYGLGTIPHPIEALHLIHSAALKGYPTAQLAMRQIDHHYPIPALTDL